MAVTNTMFIFEVVVENVQSLVASRALIIRSDFADIFSLELKDPKQMNIIIPEPPPLPPDPPGKKGKKKPKPPKPKKGKKGKVEEPPSEPAIQSGQSVLFTCTAEFLIQSMKKFPMEVSLWSKEDNLVFIGNSLIPWDPVFLTYLSSIANAIIPEPITVKEEYNVFEEGMAKIMAKIKLQVKLSYLGEKVTTSFRTLSEDPTVKKVLYTGINSKTTSYICTLKTTDEDFEENCNKIENNFTIDKPKPKIAYADYKNAPGANLTFFSDGDYCCMGNADKPPESIYKPPDTCPDINFIIDYVRKIIVSCNDNMRMLTPRPTIYPRVKATDIDRLCYCKETTWPYGKFAERFKKEAQSGPCPLCMNAGKKSEGRGTTFDIANIRGPCGKPDCRIARDMRAYIERLVEEDNMEFNLNEIVGPCGSKVCTLAEKIQEFLRREGVFTEGANKEGLSTQCACVQKMQEALNKKSSCQSVCSKECNDSDSETTKCEGAACPFSIQKMYDVFYFTVEHDFDKKTDTSGTVTPNTDQSSAYKYCSSNCPSVKASEKTSCSKTACSSALDKLESKRSDSKCQPPVCPNKTEFPASPADSNVVLNFADINTPCCVKTCDVSEKVKDFIADGLMSAQKKLATQDDPCYCDCVCTFKFTKNTTYCAVCGGYECLGDDMTDQPEFMKPHPCPVYHKIYDKKYIKTPNPWPEEETKKAPDNASTKSSRTGASKGASDRKLGTSRSMKSFERRSDKKDESKSKVKKQPPKQAEPKAKPKKKQVGKFTATVEDEPKVKVEPKPEPLYPYPPVPKNMGWNWTAEDIPGMKEISRGWKPGAISKRLLSKLNRAKRRESQALEDKPTKKAKKRVSDKPTLIIGKCNGEYKVEMKVETKEDINTNFSPLIYKITSADHEDRVKARARKEKRVIKEALKKIWSDLYHDNVCEATCLKAYKHAVGKGPSYDHNNPDCTGPGEERAIETDSCSCEDADVSSNCSSMDVDWEMHFSPPVACKRGERL